MVVAVAVSMAVSMVVAVAVHSLANDSYGWMFVARRSAATLLYMLIFFGPLNGIFIYALAGQEICEQQ